MFYVSVTTFYIDIFVGYSKMINAKNMHQFKICTGSNIKISNQFRDQKDDDQMFNTRYTVDNEYTIIKTL